MSEATLFRALNELVDECSDAHGDWEDVVRRANIGVGPTTAGAEVLEARWWWRRRWLTPRRLVLAVLVAVLLATLFATPAFGLLRNLVERIDLPFTGKTAPLVVKRNFDDFFSVGAPPGMDPRAISSETRRVFLFHASGSEHVLYVAPTRGGGFCELFTDGFGGCRPVRTPPTDYPPPRPGEVNPFLLSLTVQTEGAKPEHAILLGGDILAENAAHLTVEYEDGSSSRIPFVFVSKPIDAGFFFFEIPHGHVEPGTRASAVTVRGADGEVLAREPIEYLGTSPPTSPDGS
jgi:hypothetical protein